MPIFEVEKSGIVLDIGSSFTKIGISGEYSPRFIIRSEVKCPKTQKIRNIFDYKDEQDFYDVLVNFIHLIYFKYCLINSKDKPIIIVESLLAPTLFRETLAKVLFLHYSVSSILFLPSHLVSLAPLAHDTALVVDIGYLEAVAIPICYGLPIIHAWQALPIGSQAVHSNLKALLASKNLNIENIDEKIIEDIKVRCCFVTKKSRADQLQQEKPDLNLCPDVDYPLEGNTIVKVTGDIREKAYEILFEEDNDHLSLPSMILDAISKLNVDLRNTAAENILLIGGTAMAAGIKSRLMEELKDRLSNNRYSNLNIRKFKFHSAPSKENYTAWLGGSIYGATEWLHSKALVRDVYLKDKMLPDWSNLKYNGKIKF